MKRRKRFLSKLIQKLQIFDKLGLIDKYRRKRLLKHTYSENEKIESAPPISMDWPDEMIKPYVGLVKESNYPYSYWPKFERFLQTNNFRYDYFNPCREDFIEEAKKYDVIIWRSLSDYYDISEARSKIYFLERVLEKKVLPNYESLWYYEDKIHQYWLLKNANFPVIKTYAGFDHEETVKFLNDTSYPIVSKLRTASGSHGVELIKNKNKAKRIVNKIFNTGRNTNYIGLKQKDYVIFQEIVPNYGFDLRIIVIGDSYFGYYRYPNKKDFRASGSGITEKKDIPIELLHLSRKVKNIMPKSYMLAIDYLQDRRDNKYYIIEISIFIAIETSEQLMVNDIPGRYLYKNDKFIFQEGRFWLQELMLEEFFKEIIKGNSK